ALLKENTLFKGDGFILIFESKKPSENLFCVSRQILKSRYVNRFGNLYSSSSWRYNKFTSSD
ncbi:unnamed protein product, partial [Arabidopsis halleri]